MTRVNWLIELKILFEGLVAGGLSGKSVAISQLIKTIEDHTGEFVLIEESGYKSTHSEIGLSPYDILDSLRKLNSRSGLISYDEIFTLISQLTHEDNANAKGTIIMYDPHANTSSRLPGLINQKKTTPRAITM